MVENGGPRYRGNPVGRTWKSARPTLRVGLGRTEKPAMTKPVFQLSAAFAGLVLLCFLTFEGKTLGQSMGLIEGEEEPVLVFTIPRSEDLARVRAAIADERVLFEGDAGFVRVGGRVFVRDTQRAGDLIKIAGWLDKPIRIISLGVGSGREGEGTSSEVGRRREERLARLRKLVNKPWLTRGEQVFVLQAMNDGLEI